MPYQALKLERADFLAMVTLNRPERLNALDGQLTEELHTALDELASEDEVRAIILTGEGRGFCSGADVTGMRARAEGSEEGQAGRTRAVTQRLKGLGITQLSAHVRRVPQPVIAAVNGVCVGAGFALALSCDIRIASDQARFSSIFIKRSLTPDTGTSHMLPQLVGTGIAAEMALTGNIYDAQWALQMGLVNKVVPHDQLMAEARAMAESIAGNPPLAVRLTKRLLYRGLLSDLPQAIENEDNYNAVMADTEDSREAVLSFLEKRQAVFRGR